MAKIMLVEDDTNLVEIYKARLEAEGYTVVSAKDGEEGLAIVGQEKPDVILMDIMMPKVSGFDALDIIRNTPATKNIKVIMMTALSQAEDKSRADKLGADKYLVKSQVTLEDIVKTVKDLLAQDDNGGAGMGGLSQDSTTGSTPADSNTPMPSSGDMSGGSTSGGSMGGDSSSMPPAAEPSAPTGGDQLTPTNAMDSNGQVTSDPNPLDNSMPPADNSTSTTDNFNPAAQTSPDTNSSVGNVITPTSGSDMGSGSTGGDTSSMPPADSSAPSGDDSQKQ